MVLDLGPRSTAQRIGGLGRIMFVARRGFAARLHQIVFDAATGEQKRRQGDKQNAFHLRMLRQWCSCSLTRAGAVPPRLMREFTLASGERTLNTSAVMAGSIACMSARASLSKLTPLSSATFTIEPEM